MMVASPIERRDPGLVTVRRAVRVAAAATVGFYVCRYAVDNAVLATYALFAAIAMGFLSQIAGPAVRKVTTLLLSLPVAAVLVTIGSLIAGNLWVASAGMLVFGFLIAYAGVGGPRLVGLAAGMQLLFILPGFPPYALNQLPSRLGGVAVGIGLLALAELLLWPDPEPVKVEDRVATAAEALGGLLLDRAAGGQASPTGRAGPSGSTFDAADRAAEAVRPSHLPPAARPAGAGRHDRALSHASSLLRYALVRLHQLPPLPPVPPAAARLLASAGQGAIDAAGALRGGPLPQTGVLARAYAELRQEQRAEPAQPVPTDAYNTTLTLAVGDAVWAMVTAVRVARGGPVEVGHGTRKIRRERFPYAYLGPVRLWWRRFAIHLTPRSVYFQQAVRVAVALAIARLVAGALELQHGFWVLLATLTLLRSRAADTRIALRPALIGTVGGAVAAGIILYLIGNNTSIYAALLPPVMLLAFAAGVVLGPAWGQAMFTVAITFVFTQLAPASVSLAGVRLLDVLVGAVIGVGAGVLAWPRGASGELRRSTANFLASGGDLVRETAHDLSESGDVAGRGLAESGDVAGRGIASKPADLATGEPSRADPSGAEPRPREPSIQDLSRSRPSGAEPAQPPSTQADDPTVIGSPVASVAVAVAVAESGETIDRVKRNMALADASYSMYQAERHSPAESMVDWQAVLVAGHHILRGSELLRDSSEPGSLGPWRDLVDGSADKVDTACEQLAGAIAQGQDPRVAPFDLAPAPDSRVIDVLVWLAGVRDDLERIGRTPTGPDLSAE